MMMSNLLEKLKSKSVLSVEKVVDGDTYLIKGLDLNQKSKVYASARKSDGSLDSLRLDASFLAQCVCDPDSKAPLADATVWRNAPTHISGPLLGAIADVCGLNVDTTVDPKDFDSTPN